MHKGLQLSLLGPVQIQRDGKPIEALTSLKPQALLIYLALNRQPHTRSALAGLLWGDILEQSARANLRMALSILRKSVGDYLETTRKSVAFRSVEPYWIDVSEFEQICHRRDLQDADQKSLRDATLLYRGEFLDNFYVPDALLFDEWATIERERLRRIAEDCLSHLVKQALAKNLLSEGIEDCRRLLSLSSWREEAHRQLMTLLARNGERSAALHQFDICQQVLAEELGVEPTQETRKLYEQIKAGELIREDPRTPTSVPAPLSIPHNLPAQTTPFIGRAQELSRMATLLQDPGCRLLTLAGPGGIGKTRLALQVARERIGVFAGGNFFVRLSEINTTKRIPAAISEALDFRFSGPADPKDQLIGYLRDKHLLLVLDNFEQLMPEGVSLLLEFLENCGQIKILVTSRESLNLYEEWVVDLQGLEYPLTAGVADVENFSAVQLFVQRAQRVHLGFSLSDESKAVVRICQMMDGVPLGIELAASGVRGLPVATIADQIQHNLDLISSEQRNIPARQRSLRATFEYSWSLLTDHEQHILARLSVFVGGFDARAAKVITTASLRTLSALANKSLLIRTPTGRYEIHAVLRQYTAERLTGEPLDQEKTQVEHARFYADFAYQHEMNLRLADPVAIREAIREMGNLQAAWEWGLEHTNQKIIEHLHTSLYYLNRTQGLYDQGVSMLQNAAERLTTAKGMEKESDISLLLARLRLQRADLVFLLGQYQQARTEVEACLSSFRESGSPKNLAEAQRLLGVIIYRSGDYPAARIQIEQSLESYRQIKNEWGIALCLTHLGNILHDQGDYLAAEKNHLESLSLHKNLGNRNGVATCLSNLGRLKHTAREIDSALEYLQQSLAVFREIGTPSGISLVLMNLGMTVLEVDRFAEAKAYFEESYQLRSQIGNRRGMAAALDGLGLALYGLGELEEARQVFQEGLSVAYAIPATPRALAILVSLSQVQAKLGHPEQALRWVFFTFTHPANIKENQGIGEKFVQELTAGLSPEVVASTRADAAQLTLESVVSEALNNS